MTKKINEISAETEKAIIHGKDILASKQDVLLRTGQASAFNFMKKIADMSELKILSEIKQTKQYKGLTYTDASGQLLTVGSWDEYCSHILGSSKSTIDERLINLMTLGEEFFEHYANYPKVSKH